MKYLILFLSFNLFGYVNYYPENKSTGGFSDKKVCEKTTKEACYDLDSVKDITIHLVKDIIVDDFNKPIYALAMDIVDCVMYNLRINDPIPQDHCPKVAESINVGTANDPIEEFSLCTDKTYFALYAYKKDFPILFPGVVDDSYFAYCTKILAYQKKTIRLFVEDANLKQAKDDALIQKAADEAAKKADKIATEITLDICLNMDPNTAKAKDIAQCTIPILKYIREHM